jgi:hypothetical protein
MVHIPQGARLGATKHVDAPGVGGVMRLQLQCVVRRTVHIPHGARLGANKHVDAS